MKLLRQGGILCFAFLVSACASTQSKSEPEELLTALPPLDRHRYYRGPSGSESEELRTTQAWEPARVKRMESAGRQAWERGNMAEVERLCVELLEYVDASTNRSLYEYASLLKALKRDNAEVAWARAEKLRWARSQPGSAFLGYGPSTELQAYAALLREVGRHAEAEATQALAETYMHVQVIRFFRAVTEFRGGDPTRICFGTVSGSRAQ